MFLTAETADAVWVIETRFAADDLQRSRSRKLHRIAFHRPSRILDLDLDARDDVAFFTFDQLEPRKRKGVDPLRFVRVKDQGVILDKTDTCPEERPGRVRVDRCDRIGHRHGAGIGVPVLYFAIA